MLTGDTDAAAVVATAHARGFERLLHLAGRDRVATGAMVRIVYAAEAVAIPLETVRSPPARSSFSTRRAAARLAERVDAAGLARDTIALVAISAKTAAAAGNGWRAVALAEAPRDDAMIAAAQALTRTAATGISGA